jgi:hypothetical protein
MYRVRTLSLILILVSALGASCGPKCDQGYGVDQDGECVPFKHGEGDADTDADGDVGNPADGELEMIGEWETEEGEAVVITTSTWTESIMDGDGSIDMIFRIEDFWNENDFLVAQNDENNDDGNGGLWSRFDWSLDGNGAWVCPTVCCAATKDEALNEEAADASDPSNEGCGDSEWTRLTRQ